MSGPRQTRRFTSGDSARSLINPTNGYREQLMRRGVKPKNHARANRAAIRDAEARNRVKKAQEEGRAAAQAFKMERFRNVEGRVSHGRDEQENEDPTPRMLERAAERQAAARRRSDGRRRVSTAGSEESARARAPYVPREKSKPRAPRRDEVNVIPPRPPVDFVNENRADAVRMRPPSQHSPDQQRGPGSRGRGGPNSPRMARPGEVPAYLQERKEQWRREEEQRQLEAGDPDCPPGTQLMPDAERRETLRVLLESQEELKRQMNALPLTCETISSQRRKQAVENKLKEVEDAVAIFDQEKVYITQD